MGSMLPLEHGWVLWTSHGRGVPLKTPWWCQMLRYRHLTGWYSASVEEAMLLISELFFSSLIRPEEKPEPLHPPSAGLGGVMVFLARGPASERGRGAQWL